MVDQAAKLRELVEEIERKNGAKFSLDALPAAKRVIGITSGKGGVGKTNLVANLAFCLAHNGSEVLLIDSSSNVANIGVILGLNSKVSLQDVFLGKRKVEDIKMEKYPKLSVLMRLKEMDGLSSLGRQQQQEIIRDLAEYESKFDLLLIDSGASVNQEELKILSACGEIILITTPESTSLMETYSVIKALAAKSQQIKFYLIINMVKNEEQAEVASKKIINAGKKFLKKDILNLGYIFADKNVIKAIESQKPHILLYPYTSASLCVKKIAEILIEEGQNFDKVEQRGFFRHLAKGIKFQRR